MEPMSIVRTGRLSGNLNLDISIYSIDIDERGHTGEASARVQYPPLPPCPNPLVDPSPDSPPLDLSILMKAELKLKQCLTEFLYSAACFLWGTYFPSSHFMILVIRPSLLYCLIYLLSVPYSLTSSDLQMQATFFFSAMRR